MKVQTHLYKTSAHAHTSCIISCLVSLLGTFMRLLLTVWKINIACGDCQVFLHTSRRKNAFIIDLRLAF
jgi:hypothetical protein